MAIKAKEALLEEATAKGKNTDQLKKDVDKLKIDLRKLEPAS